MKKDVREFYLSVDDVAWEMVVKVYTETLQNGVLWGTVLYISRDDKGDFYYGSVDGRCTPAIMTEKEAVIAFLEENESGGYAVGQFDTIGEVNEDYLIDSSADPLFDTFGLFDLRIFDKYTK